MPLREANAVGTVGSWGNVGYLGIPLSVTVLGPATGFPAALVSTIHTALAISVFLVAATLIDRDRSSRGLLARTVARRVLGNPIVIAIVLGLLVAVSGWTLPRPVATTVELIGPWPPRAGSSPSASCCAARSRRCAAGGSGRDRRRRPGEARRHARARDRGGAPVRRSRPRGRR